MQGLVPSSPSCAITHGSTRLQTGNCLAIRGHLECELGFCSCSIALDVALNPACLVQKAKTLNVFTLGDDVASSLGTPVERDRRILLLLAVALAGASVAAGGAIAFIGLVVPHIARRIIGPLHQYIIPISTLLGALLLMGADLFGKNLLTPTMIPAGIIVSIISAPYFIYLLMKVK